MVIGASKRKFELLKWSNSDQRRGELLVGAAAAENCRAARRTAPGEAALADE
jgi:hypothetical protein